MACLSAGAQVCGMLAAPCESETTPNKLNPKHKNALIEGVKDRADRFMKGFLRGVLWECQETFGAIQERLFLGGRAKLASSAILSSPERGGTMVSLSQICKVYQGQTKVLDHLNFELKRGDFVYLVGGTGAGKSSLLRILATEEAPSSGKLSLFGQDLNQVSPSGLRAIRRMIGYIPQGIQLIPDLSVFDNVALSLSLSGGRAWLSAEARQKTLSTLERLGISSKKERRAGTLSGGEAQRVAVARALVREPELILADEPTGSQDQEHTWSIMDLFLKANLGGTTVVVATHDREIVRRVRKKALTLRNGRISLEENAVMMT